MKSRYCIRFIANIQRLLLCLTLGAVSPFSQALEADLSAQAQAILVSNTVPKLKNWSQQVPAQGEVLAWQVAIVSSKTSNINAIDIKVLEGDTVIKGQILAEFDKRILRAELNQKKADLALAEANLHLAQTNLARFEQVEYRQSLSQQELDIVSNQLDVATANRQQAKATEQLAQLQLANATIASPATGKILERNLELGQVTQPGDVLFRILRQHKLVWVAEVDASELVKIKLGMSAQLTTQDGQIVMGVVHIVSPQLSSQSRLGKVHVLLDEGSEIAVNSYNQGAIILGSGKALVLPASAIVIKDGKTFVFRIEGGLAQQVLVSLGRRQHDEIEILSGVQMTDQIALEGAGFLNDGDKVLIKPSIDRTEVGAK